MMNILSYVDFSKLCNVVKFPPELNKDYVKEGITFTPSSSPRSIKWIKEVNELEPCVEKLTQERTMTSQLINLFQSILDFYYK